MSRSKQLKAYSQTLITIAMKCGGQRIELPFPDSKRAAAMRLTLYGLRGAITAEGAQDMFPGFLASQIVIELSEDGSARLVIAPPELQHTEESEMLAQIAEQLGAGPFPQQSATPLGAAIPGYLPPPSAAELAASDPYAAYLAQDTHSTASTPSTATPPVDPFDLSSARRRIEGFESAVSAWLSSAPESPGDSFQK